MADVISVKPLLCSALDVDICEMLAATSRMPDLGGRQAVARRLNLADTDRHLCRRCANELANFVADSADRCASERTSLATTANPVPTHLPERPRQRH